MDWEKIRFDRYDTEVKFEELTGKTIVEIEALTSDNTGRLVECVVGPEAEVLIFRMSDGEYYKMFHDRDCCESAWLEDVVGDANDLTYSPIVEAYESSNSSDDAVHDEPAKDADSNYTWTFYRIQTGKGCVTLRWFATSNGYYSERMSLVKGIPYETQGA